MSDALPYRPKTGDIPTEPGVYRFIDGRGRVLYVGKAKNLRARLSNYFAPLSSLHERTRRMVLSASEVSWTVVGSEVEALQLEWIWINEFDPPFNVQFKDDKSYPYLVVTLGEEAPRVFASRRRGISGARYFGPYPQVWAVYETLDLLRKLFPMRTCKDSDYRKAMQSGKPCFASQIGRCFGPCSHRVTVEDHRAVVNRFVGFMNNPDRRVLSELTEKMNAAAGAQDYEAAARYRDQLQAAASFFKKSAVVLRDGVDIDLFGVAHDELSAAVQEFKVRGGMIRGLRAWTVDKELDVSIGELVESVLQRAYGSDETPPAEVVVPALPADAPALNEWLSEIAGRRVSVKIAQRGEKAALMDTAERNAKHALLLHKNKRSTDFTARSKALEDLQIALNLESAPLRIECFDVSHLQGSNIVASMVVFEDGLPRKDLYRKFNIGEARDDTEAIHQVLSRRLAHLDDDGEAESVPSAAEAATEDGEAVVVAPKRKRFAYRPQLLLVDGGAPQVAAAERALVESGAEGIALAGIAKRLEEIWLPGEDYPVILPRNSEALFLIQRARDEAHRFAITAQRAKRKKDIATVLGEIPGLGPARVKALLREFGSVSRLKTASIAEIESVSGIGANLASLIHATLAESSATRRH